MKDQQSQPQTENVVASLRNVIRWGDVRWNAVTVLDILKPATVPNPTGVFVLDSSDIQKLQEQIPDLENTRVRGYLGLNSTYKELQLILVAEDRDINMWLYPPAPDTTEQLVVGSYSTEYSEEKIKSVINDIRNEPGRADMATRIERWYRTYDVYVPLVAREEKLDTTGLVRLFDIPGGDLLTEIEDSCNLVFCFFALYPNATVELIFQGIKGGEKEGEKVQLVKRRQKVKAKAELWAPMASDFTTPRPPFDSETGYGLIQ